MTVTTNAEKLRQYKTRFSLIVDTDLIWFDLMLAFASCPNIVRGV